MDFEKKQIRGKLLSLFASTLLCSLSFPVWSNGFFLPEQNVTNLGTAYAGTAALATDASTNFYNPAGLTRLCGEELVAGGILVLPYTKLDVSFASTNTGVPLSPSAGTVRPSNATMIPLLHYSNRIDDNWAFGISAVTLFGSKTDYRDNTLVRYTATSSKMITADLTPSLAYNFCNGFSLGVGLDMMYTYAKLAQAITIGTGDLALDGFSEVSGDATSLGYHVGAMMEFSDCSRIGLTYHSRFRAKLKGNSTSQIMVGFPLVVQGARADIDFPEFVVFSAYQGLSDCWAVMMDAGWFRWDRYKILLIRFNDGGTTISQNDWKNTYRVALGASYQWNNCLLFRFGASFDKTPTKDATRPIFLPDQDQTALAVGGQYRFTDVLAMDFGYVHVFYRKANLDTVAPLAGGGLPQGLQRVRATSKTHIDALGLQFTYDFG